MKLEDYIVKKCNEQTNIDISTDSVAMQRVKDVAEKALIELKSISRTEINLPFITADKEGPKHLKFTLNKDWEKPAASSSGASEIVFQKHRQFKKDEKNQKNILLIMAIIIFIITGLLVYLMR